MEKKSVSQRLTALIATGALASAMMVPAVALAADIEPSAGAQTGTGTTEVTVQNVVGSDEHSTPEVDPTNPDDDPEDGLGDNIAFTVPSAINFVADARGVLTGPSASATYIENESVFGIYVSSFDVDAENGWTIIKDGKGATAANSADFQFGPSGDPLDAYDYLNKSDVGNPRAWQMEYAQSDGVADRVQMETSGNIFKVNKDITSQSKIATIKTYVKAGTAQ